MRDIATESLHLFVSESHTMGRSLNTITKAMRTLGVGSTVARGNCQLKHGRVFTIVEAKPSRNSQNVRVLVVVLAEW